MSQRRLTSYLTISIIVTMVILSGCLGQEEPSEPMQLIWAINSEPGILDPHQAIWGADPMGILFQPLIYSSSVNAHPLEIFLVIMIAGSLAGIPGMIIAIPLYTVIRVFAKEFFNKFKVVKKLTKKIS